MLKFYRNFMKKKIEKEIKQGIEYNKWVINIYKNKQINSSKLNIPKQFEDDVGTICITYEAYKYDKYFKKYDINKELYDKVIRTSEIANKEYDLMVKRLKEQKVKQEVNKKIKLYKQAILQLKKEGKI